MSGLGARFAAEAQVVSGTALRDASLYTLLAANVALLGIALVSDLSLPHLLAAFWAQGVIIGVTSLLRVVALRRYLHATEDKGTAALIFVSLYGGMHYLFFTLVQDLGRQRGVHPFAGVEFWLCAAVFAAHHVFSLRHNLERDAEGRPSLQVLLLMPYIRSMPMALAGAVALALPSGILPYVVTVAAKTWIDVMMHAVEHHVLRKGKPLGARSPWPDLGPPV